MIQINKIPGQRVLELGCGANRNPATDVGVDIRPGPGVDFPCDFSKTLPISSNEFDCVLSVFCLEHLSYTVVPSFLKECLRVLKDGGRTVMLVPNTEAQIKWVLEHPEGWDGKNLFESASCKLFGDQRHGERLGDTNPTVDSHKCYFNQAIISNLFMEAGFIDIQVRPFGERQTDMSVEAIKPARGIDSGLYNPVVETVDASPDEKLAKESKDLESVRSKTEEPIKEEPKPIKYEPTKLFDRKYFDMGGIYGPFGYFDFPCHELTARHIMMRQPKSVLELGCGRNYIVRRLQKAGYQTVGMDVSKHCYLTRASDGFLEWDVTKTPWPFPSNQKDFRYDLCFSIDFLDRIPEQFIDEVAKEMERTCKTGLHGLDFNARLGQGDLTRCTVRDKGWWKSRLPNGHEIVHKNDLEGGVLPEEYRNGDGKIKLNIGSASTMFHYGWINLDSIDLGQFANAWGYRFQQCDVLNGLPFATGTVDLIFTSHFLEHLPYRAGLAFLRDCRRVLKPDTGAMRILVPDAYLLNCLYVKCMESNGRLDETIFIDGYKKYSPSLLEFGELNSGCGASPNAIGKVWALLHEGHQAAYDAGTLLDYLDDSGFVGRMVDFNKEGFKDAGFSQINRECIDMLPDLSLIADAKV